MDKPKLGNNILCLGIVLDQEDGVRPLDLQNKSAIIHVARLLQSCAGWRSCEVEHGSIYKMFYLYTKIIKHTFLEKS